MKRILSILLVLLLLVTLFNGCTKDDDSGDATTKATTTKAAATTTAATTTTKGPPVSITAMLRQSPTDAWDDSMIQKYIEEAFNLIIKFEPVDWDAYNERYNVRVASANIADMMTPRGGLTTTNDYGERGLFLDINTILEHIPRLNVFFENLKGHYEQLFTNKGQLFVVPGVYTSSRFENFLLPLQQGGIGVRGDLLDKLGVKTTDVKTFDDLYELFVKLRDINDGKPVFTFRGQVGSIGGMAESWGTSVDPLYWNYLEEKWEGSYYKEETRDLLRYLAKMYDEGILDPDWPTVSSDIWYEKSGTGDFTAYWDSHPHLQFFTDKLKAAGMEDAYFTHIHQPESPYGIRHKIASFYSMYDYMVISAETEAPAQIGQLINWLYSEEGYQMIWFGEENVDYINQGGVYKRLVETNKEAIPEQYRDLMYTEEVYNQRQSEVPFLWYLYGWLLTSSMDDWLGLGTLLDPENETTKMLDWYSELVELDLIRGPNPEPQFTTEEGEQIIDLTAPVETLIEETITRMIIGDLSVEDDWDSFIETLKSMDYDKIIELHNDTIGR